MKQLILKSSFAVVIFLSFALQGRAQQTRPLKPEKFSIPYTQYYKIRGGLNNFFAAVSNKKATVAFLGGSITYNPGWREMVIDYLRKSYSKTNFKFISAGIPSLGSLPHVFRLQHDVLDSGKIDLLFVEAAVNDRVNGTDSLTQVRDLEGIVRHVKSINSRTDIIMMSFADPDKNSDYAKGKIPAEVFNHELVATHYGLPSINLAKEVYDKIQNKEFTWKEDFVDLHPSPFGQQLYFANMKSLLQNCNKPAKNRFRKVLPKPLNALNFAHGNYNNINKTSYDHKWTINNNWMPKDGLATRPGFVNVPMLITESANAELALSFSGTAVGMAVVSGQDAGIVSYSVDGSAYKDVDLYTPWSGGLHLPWYILFSGDLKKGNHVLKLKTLEKHNANSKGNACRIVNFMINE